MTKPKVIQTFEVVMEHKGIRRFHRVCCAPAIHAIPGRIVAYRPIGTERRGTCCH